MPEYIPPGWHSITSRLVARYPEALVLFLKRAFGASGEFTAGAPAVMRIGDSTIMVSGTGPRDPTASLLYLYVADADATFGSACRAGASVLEEPTDTSYGDRRAMVRDPFGNDWQIATYMGPPTGL